MSIPDKDAEKLGQVVAAMLARSRATKPTEYDVEKANAERTPREEAERAAAEAGLTPEGKIIDAVTARDRSVSAIDTLGQSTAPAEVSQMAALLQGPATRQDLIYMRLGITCF